MNTSASINLRSGSAVSRTSTKAPPVTLHSEKSVGIAAFLGTPLAGSLLIAHNLKKLDKTGPAAVAVLGGFAAAALIVVLAVTVGDKLPPAAGTFIGLGYAMGMKKIATNLFPAEYQAIDEGQAPAHTAWIGAGVGLACSVAVVAALFFSM